MKIQRIYVDTSVIGGCHDDEFSLWSNGLVRDFREGNYKPVLSEIVGAEIESAPQRVQQTYAEILAICQDFIEITPEVIRLSEVYQEHEILQVKFFADMRHVALATVSQADVLVSWNFKHIVHMEKIRLFNAVNLELGYKQILIYSPREVTSYG